MRCGGRAEDLRGRNFGRLVVLDRHTVHVGKRVGWVCRCRCGVEKTIRADLLTRGLVTSCGCYRIELMSALGRANLRHGKCGSKVYRTWVGMMERCHWTPEEHYGDRGITVCKRWHRFENFYADMGDPPTASHSIDRRNNDRGYSRSNCKWSTRVEQARNKRGTRFVTIDAVTRAFPEWCEVSGVKPDTARTRWHRGWRGRDVFYGRGTLA